MKYDITFHPKWWYKHADIHFTEEFFTEPEYRMECDVKMRKALYEHFGEYGIGEKAPEKRPLIGSDLLACGYLYSQIMGCEIIFEEDNSPQVVCMGLDEDTIEDLEYPNLETNEIWLQTKKQLAYLKDNYGRVETYVNLMGIQNIALDLMGQELMVAYYTNPEAIEELLDEITKMSITIGKTFQSYSDHISAGVTAITKQTVPNCYLTSNCSVEMISNELYEEFLLKHDQALADAFGNFGVHHCGQTMEHVVEGYSKLKGLVFAEVGAGSDLAAVRAKLPDVFLNARFSPAELLSASDEEIRAKVQKLKADGDTGNGKLSISCVGIDQNVSDEKICAFLKACKEL
ncbi:MAG: hypothetical protein HFI75_13615 [Lachnospiraceae bacterium]|nr:hypothetical protein [Lachnospiraceae bacterium]